MLVLVPSIKNWNWLKPVTVLILNFLKPKILNMVQLDAVLAETMLECDCTPS